MIPGVNEQHLAEVSRTVKGKGAFLHNVMPLIAEAEHGTFFGLMGQRGPTPAELQALQDQCAGDMNMMRHCRQCRADAVGLLGEDRGPSSRWTRSKRWRSITRPRWKRAPRFTRRFARAGAGGRRPTGHPGVAGGNPSGADGRRQQGRRADQRALRPCARVPGLRGFARGSSVYRASQDRSVLQRRRYLRRRRVRSGPDHRALAGCEVVLCSKVGFEPWEHLEAAGIQPNGEHAMEPIEEAVAAVYLAMFQEGRLTEAAPGSRPVEARCRKDHPMALKINDLCVNCWACVDVCPTESIRAEPQRHFIIDPTNLHRMRGSLRGPAVCLDLSDRRGHRPPQGLRSTPPAHSPA